MIFQAFGNLYPLLTVNLTVQTYEITCSFQNLLLHIPCLYIQWIIFLDDPCFFCPVNYHLCKTYTFSLKNSNKINMLYSEVKKQKKKVPEHSTFFLNISVCDVCVLKA